MKKFLGVLVALTLCVCLLAPVSFAAEENSLTDLLAGVDLGGLTEDDLAEILGGLDVENFDVEGLLAELEGGSEDALVNLEEALGELDAEYDVAEKVETSTDAVDLSFLTDILSGDMDTSAFTDMLSGITEGDLTSILGTVSTAFTGSGIDLASFNLGSFDIASVLGTAGGEGDIASTLSTTMGTLADTMLGGLKSLGLDTTTIEGLLDNDIVNFFANMYIGFLGKVEEPTTTTTTTTTTKPAVVTTTTPKTGDTSAVIAAIATLSVASAAAFVCLKKKED